MKVAVTGTPGTGKTTVAKGLSEETDLKYVSVNKLAREKDCIISYDDRRESDVVDVKKLRNETNDLENCVLDGHLSHFLAVDKVIVLRCKPSSLKDRLEGKGWDEDKVMENVESEIAGIIEREARNSKERVYSIDTTDKSPKQVVDVIINIFEGEDDGVYSQYFDWIERDEVETL